MSDRIYCAGCGEMFSDYDLGAAFGKSWCYRCWARMPRLKLHRRWSEIKDELRSDVEYLRLFGFWRWVYSKFFYRAHMHLIHRMHFCHMKPMPVIDRGPQQHWCQWCGMRGYK
jgi:hypothetical protein